MAYSGQERKNVKDIIGMAFTVTTNGADLHFSGVAQGYERSIGKERGV